MTVAINDQGQAVRLEGNQWVPAEIAENDAGDRVVFDGQQWVPVGQPQQPQAAPTLEEETRATFGLNDIPNRPMILPLMGTADDAGGALMPQTGVRPVVPQVGVELLQSLALPRRVAQGRGFTPQQGVRFTTDVAAPGSARVLPGRRAVSRQEFVRDAPDPQGLKQMARDRLAGARERGVRINQDEYLDLLADIESDLSQAGIDPTPGGVGLNPQVNALLNAYQLRLGRDVDLDDFLILRQQLTGIRPGSDNEARLLNTVRRRLDGFVDGLPGGRDVREFRRLWGQAKRTEIIDDILANAELDQRDPANFIRNEVRKILRARTDAAKRRKASFSPAEIRQMARIASSRNPAAGLRALGVLGFGGERALGPAIGTSGGAGLGAMIAGPAGAQVGALTLPVLATGARRAGQRVTQNQADMLRAMVARGEQPANVQFGPLIDQLANRAVLPAATRLAPPQPLFDPITGQQLPPDLL